MKNHTNHTNDRTGPVRRARNSDSRSSEPEALQNAADLPEVFGTATVGDRGQIVIPQPAREKYRISPGDRLVVLGGAFGAGGLLLVRAEVVGGLLAETVKRLSSFKESINKAGLK
jgi:AbrB family looped-hinge helix DNA binding protein